MVPYTEGLQVDILHGDLCLVVKGAVNLLELPLKASGNVWPVGTKFLRLGDKRKSAGFINYSFAGFPPLEYVGQHHDLDGRLALFRAGDLPPAGEYFGFHLFDDDGGIHFGNANHASRMCRMTDCETV